MKGKARTWVLLVGASLLIVASASAGAKFGTPVYIQPGEAWGGLGGARNSQDPYQQIGCWVVGMPGFVSAGCHAVDAAGNALSCFSWDPSFIAAAQSIGGDSWVVFDVDDSGRCTFLQISSFSSYEPKQP